MVNEAFWSSHNCPLPSPTLTWLDYFVDMSFSLSQLAVVLTHQLVGSKMDDIVRFTLVVKNIDHNYLGVATILPRDTFINLPHNFRNMSSAIPSSVASRSYMNHKACSIIRVVGRSKVSVPRDAAGCHFMLSISSDISAYSNR
nr:hypothetical protein CFP56_11087 [Quercus suber]